MPIIRSSLPSREDTSSSFSIRGHRSANGAGRTPPFTAKQAAANSSAEIALPTHRLSKHSPKGGPGFSLRPDRRKNRYASRLTPFRVALTLAGPRDPGRSVAVRPGGDRRSESSRSGADASSDLGPQSLERFEERVAVGLAERLAAEPADPGVVLPVRAHERVAYIEFGDSEMRERVQELLAAALLHAAPPFARGKPSPVDDAEEHTCQSRERTGCYTRVTGT